MSMTWSWAIWPPIPATRATNGAFKSPRPCDDHGIHRVEGHSHQMSNGKKNTFGIVEEHHIHRVFWTPGF